MDPEQTFIRVQERFSDMLTPKIRVTLEYLYLLIAITLFCILVVMHANYVQQPGCSSEISGVDLSQVQLIQIKISSVGSWTLNETEHDIIIANENQESERDLKVANLDGDGTTLLSGKFWLEWLSSGAMKDKSPFKYWKTYNEFSESQAEGSTVDENSVSPTHDEIHKIKKDGSWSRFSLRESLRAAVVHLGKKWYGRISLFWRVTNRILGGLWECTNLSWIYFMVINSMVSGFLKRFLLICFYIIFTQDIAGIHLNLDIPKWLRVLHLDRLNSYAVQWLGTRSKKFEPTYLYTMEKGYFLLPEEARSKHNIRTVNVSISAWHPCFGNRWQQLLINRLVGYDTILMNSLLNSPGQGYLYNFQTNEFYNLTYAHKQPESSAGFGDYLVTKCGVFMMSLFVFFTTTMSVSFTLRETQTRMLKFTVQLQHHARHRLPTFQLIFVHVIESLVFVPIMIGILFFLFEFYDDQLLAFLVLILVWLCELFTLISVRTPISMKFFPRFFLLYFLVFHIYFFSYTYGFSYLALCTTAAFMQHLILYFWNRFEVPALQRFVQNRRFQQHPDFHITSSTILASTLHITRLNTRNSGILNPESASGSGLQAGVGLPEPINDPAGFNGLQDRVDNGNPGRLGNPLHLDLRQSDAAGNPGSMNSFSSLLLWILGGASSEGLNSFLSMFRDLRYQGQGFTGSAQQENHAPQRAE